MCDASVSAVDLSMDGVVGISWGQDTIISIGQDWGQGYKTGSLWPVEHLRFELGKFVFQVGKLFGQGLHDAGVDVAHHTVIGGPKVL